MGIDRDFDNLSKGVHMYLAILYAQDYCGSGETLSMSREVDTLDRDYIVTYLMKEAGISKDEIDTILVIQNGESRPSVVKHWTGRNGDI